MQTETATQQLTLKEGNYHDLNAFLIGKLKEETAKEIGKTLAYQNAHFARYLENDEGKMVGGIVANATWGILHINQLWVDEDFRNQGYGGKLLELAEAFGRQHGCKIVSLKTILQEAISFYEGQGFQAVTDNESTANSVACLFFLNKRLN